MALKNQLSFASGEISPILHDRVTLDRFQNGLATARNVMIGKTGSILSRFSRSHFKEIHHDGPVKIFSPPDTEDIIEFGVNSVDDKFYVRYYRWNNSTHIYEYIETLAGDTGITSDNLTDLQFVVDEIFIYLFLGSESAVPIHRVRYGLSPLFTPDDTFSIPIAPPGTVTITEVGSPTGYIVDYAFTYVRLGEESEHLISNTTTINKPISIGQSIDIELVVSNSTVLFEEYSEVRVYRRPHLGSAFGLIGTTSEVYVDGFDIKAKFTDIGADADFNNGLQSLVTKEGLSGDSNVTDLKVGTGLIYQGRLLLGNFTEVNQEAIAASRPGQKRNFFRDFPYDSNSALLFKTSSEGNARIVRMIDNDGLVVFTTRGVFVSLGVLSVSNLNLVKRGGWIIDESIPPLLLPGALLFVDKTTNTIRQLVYSQELSGYDSIDQSVFSDHLFKTRSVKSWSYQEGIAPILIVTFSDGTFATFTYSFEHKMRAWTRHDSKFPVEQVTSTSVADTSFFVVNKNGTRVIEKTVPRYITPSVLENNSDADKLENGAFMDSIVTSFNLLNDGLTPVDTGLTLVPVTPGDWEGQLTLTCSISDIFDPLGLNYGNAGEIYKIFNKVDRTEIDLTFVSQTDNNTIIVQPSEEYPSAQSSDFQVYLIENTVSGLSHLEGESVSVMVDGNVIASPNNDNQGESFVSVTVTAGSITIPNDLTGAIYVVGRPITADVQTLNVSTVEQSPTMIESLTVNKVYIRTFESRGTYIDNVFPEEKSGLKNGTSVKDMQTLDKYNQQSGVPIKGNRYKQPTSERSEITIPGSWNTQGKVSMRQVDPLHFEILSIIPDLEVHRRSDR